MTAPRDPRSRATVASFVANVPVQVGRVTLDTDDAHHARVRRLADGDPVTVRDGAGAIGDGQVARLVKHALDVEITYVAHVPPPAPVHLFAPVADRDRMLWLAEKAVEIGVTSWRTVRWERSRSVAPRGEGDAFVAKLRMRMRQALAQCEGAWLPAVHDADDLDGVLGTLPPGARLLLDADGDDIAATPRTEAAAGISILVGPEGGLEPDEVARCTAAGFRPTRVPGNILRFETAGVVGVAFARTFAEGSSA